MLEAVLHFWFGDAADAPEIARRQQRLWWGKDPVLDATIRDRFAPLLAAEQRGEFAGETAPRALLARIVLLDQLPRNMFRGSADAFGYDARALALSRQLLANDGDRMLQPIERVFAYLPFEHAEQLADQDRAVTLFTALLAEVPEAERALFTGYLEFAEKHRQIIARFGRFPHRNAVLGRASSIDEQQFLQQPGSSF